MKYEIDQTVERIGQLPKGQKLKSQPWLKDGGVSAFPGDFIGTGDLTTDNLIELKDAYTQLKADLATAKQGLEPFVDVCTNCLCYREQHDANGEVDMLDEIGQMICGKPEYPAQQTLDKIGKE